MTRYSLTLAAVPVNTFGVDSAVHGRGPAAPCRPRAAPQDRRRRGKDDGIDGENAADVDFARCAPSPRARDGMGAIAARAERRPETAISGPRIALQMIQTRIICEHEEVLDQLRNLTRMQLVRARPSPGKT